MSFGKWRAYAQPSEFGRDIQLNIGREIALGQTHTVVIIDASGVTVTDETSPESTSGTSLPVPLDIAEAVYHALHRVFGNIDPKGTEDALKVERARVEKVLDRLLEGVK